MEKIDSKNIFTNNITGIYGISIEDLLFNFEKYNAKNLKISYIDSQNFEFGTDTLESEIQLDLNLKKIDKKIVKNKLSEYCEEFSLDEKFVTRKINTLSSSEKYMLYVILNLLFESDVYIFNDLYGCLDKLNRKKLLEILKKLKIKGKTVLIIDNINILYNITFDIYIFKDNTIVFSGKTKEILTDVEKLIKKGIEIPELPLITYLAKKKKGVKLFYHDDVRDIIKDVYKHV